MVIWRLVSNILMKGSVISLILIMTIVIFVTAMTLGWAMMNMSGFFELSEINSVKDAMAECNDNLLQTARTGLPSKCVFSLRGGEIRGTTNEIYYFVTASTRICDQSDWVLINPEKNIWQRCDVSGSQSAFSLRWNYTGVDFRYGDLGKVQVTGQSGSTIEISRYSVSERVTRLTLRIY